MVFCVVRILDSTPASASGVTSQDLGSLWATSLGSSP
jgi:hypothetical protein